MMIYYQRRLTQLPETGMRFLWRYGNQLSDSREPMRFPIWGICGRLTVISLAGGGGMCAEKANQSQRRFRGLAEKLWVFGSMVVGHGLEFIRSCVRLSTARDLPLSIKPPISLTEIPSTTEKRIYGGQRLKKITQIGWFMGLRSKGKEIISQRYPKMTSAKFSAFIAVVGLTTPEIRPNSPNDSALTHNTSSRLPTGRCGGTSNNGLADRKARPALAKELLL